jgi:N,N'-diacetyllegionaminate synthase
MYKDIPFFKVNKNKYSSKKKILIIGEIGSNHNNDYNLALLSIDAAVNAKCDAVKFQLFKADKIIQRKSPGWKILKKLELNESWIPKLKKYCRNKKILFSISVFDLKGLKLVNKYGIDFYKIASPELEDLPLIDAISKLKKPTIISTGAANLSSISKSVEVFRKNIHNNFALLHCISNYPTNTYELNLDMIKSLKQSFGVPIGFSDHSKNIYSSIIAAANGACIIEKHITLNKKLNGPDHHFALEPLELKAMVDGIRVSEKAFKNFIKQPVSSDESLFSRKIVSNKNLKKNHRITLKDLITKRVKKPYGIETFDIKKILGLRLSKSIKKDEEINWSSFK